MIDLILSLKKEAKQLDRSCSITFLPPRVIDPGRESAPMSFAAFTAFQRDFEFPGSNFLLILFLFSIKKWVLISKLRFLILFFSSIDGLCLRSFKSLFLKLSLFLMVGFVAIHNFWIAPKSQKSLSSSS